MILLANIASVGIRLLTLTSLSSKVFEMITSCAKKIFLLINTLAISFTSTLWISEERRCRFIIVILPSSTLTVSGKRSIGKACEEMLDAQLEKLSVQIALFRPRADKTAIDGSREDLKETQTEPGLKLRLPSARRSLSSNKQGRFVLDPEKREAGSP